MTEKIKCRCGEEFDLTEAEWCDHKPMRTKLCPKGHCICYLLKDKHKWREATEEERKQHGFKIMLKEKFGGVKENKENKLWKEFLSEYLNNVQKILPQSYRAKQVRAGGKLAELVFEFESKFIKEPFDNAISSTIQTIFGFEGDWEHSDTYKKILEHRKDCDKWGKEFCLDCFGGGLTKFTENLRQELKQKCEK